MLSSLISISKLQGIFRIGWREVKVSRLLRIALICVFSFSIKAQSGEETKGPDLVHHGDIIDVDVVGGFEFDWRGTLSPEGFLTGLNNFGDPIYGLCRTEAAIATDIAAAYSKILREPVVVVRIIDRSNRALVLLDGAVKKPQRFQLNRPARLRELLVLSGGISDNSSGEIQIFRPNGLNCPQTVAAVPRDNAPETVNISVRELLKGSESANPLILSGDLITVARADVIYVVGGVGNPKQVSARSQTTLSKAIAMAGGLSKSSESAVTIYRRENGETKAIAVDLKQIESGTIPDPPLKAFDIVDVPLKGSQKRRYPPILASSPNGSRSLPPLRVIE